MYLGEEVIGEKVHRSGVERRTKEAVIRRQA